MPAVNVPGFDKPIQFPDSMTPAQIQQAIETDILPNRPTPGMGKVLANGVAKGAAGLFDSVNNLPGNLVNIGKALYGFTAGAAGAPADKLPEVGPPIGFTDIAKMAFGSKAMLDGRPDLAPDVNPTGQVGSDAGRALGVIRESAEPTNTAGRITDFVGQTLGGGGINPGAIGRNLAQGAFKAATRDLAAAGASGAGAGAANEVVRNVDTGNESLNRALQAGATFAGGATPGALVAARNTAGGLAADATRGLTPQQLDLAKALAKRSTEAGTPLTGYEAMQAVTGLNPKMQTQQRLAEQSKAATDTLTPMMQARPAQNEALFNREADAIAPQSPTPDALAGQMRKAATAAINAVRNQGKEASDPFYAQSSNNPAVKVPTQDWAALVSDPGVADALRAVKAAPKWGVQDAPEGSLQWLDAAKRHLNDEAGEALRKPRPNDSRYATAAANKITSIVDPVVPAYAKARQVFADNMRNNVEPLENGQLGRITDTTGDLRSQMNALLPAKPMDVNPAVVERTVGHIAGQDPAVMPQALAQFLRGSYDSAAKDTAVGPNSKGAANFAAQIAGNSAQEANLIAALRSSGANPNGIQDALGIFRAQGMRPDVRTSPVDQQAPSKFDLFTRPLTASARFADHWRSGGASNDLAKALADPNSVDRLLELARTNGKYDPVKQQLLSALLRATPTDR